MGWFDLIRAGLKKTSQVLKTDIRDLFKQEGRLVDDQFLAELFAILVKTDMGVGPANAIRDEIYAESRARKLSMSDVIAVVKRKIPERDQANLSALRIHRLRCGTSSSTATANQAHADGIAAVGVSCSCNA